MHPSAAPTLRPIRGLRPPAQAARARGARLPLLGAIAQRGALILALGLPLGCAKRGPADPLAPPTVDDIEIVGNGGPLSGQGDFTLRAVMETQQNPLAANWLRPGKRRTYLDKDTLELDAWRIEAWYANHGYFDAVVQGWEVRTTRAGKPMLWWDPPARVKIVGDVNPGAPTIIKKVEYKGMDRLGGPLLASLKAQVPLQAEGVLVAGDLAAAEDIVREQLFERGFAFAKVKAAAEVDAAAHTAEVLVEAELGPTCKFGPVTISHLGSTKLERVPDELIRAELEVEEGKPYRVSDISTTQRRLFGLGVFSVVNVIPMLDQAEGDRVPVRIELGRSKYRQLRTGAGLLLESGKQDVHVSADFQHVNLFNRLLRLDLQNQVGYTTLVQIDQVTEDGLDEVLSTSGPTVVSDLVLSLPHWPIRAWRAASSFSFELGVEQGYRFATPQWSPSLSGQLSDRITLTGSYQLQLFQYLDLALEESEFRRTPLGLDFRERYLLTTLRQQLTYDSRDDLFVPTRGRYGLYELTEAGRWLGGDFNFVRLKGDQRFYFSLRRVLPDGLRGALALRLNGGFIQPYGDEDYATVPYAERLYLGGSGDVRGWVRNHLGPYICDPDSGVECIGTPGVEQVAAEILPIGGLVSAAGTAEVRIYSGDYGGVVFMDLGNAWTTFDQLWAPEQAGLPVTLLPSVGGGLRYLSPIGAVRLDLAWRLDDEPMFAKEPGFGAHFSLSEAF